MLTVNCENCGESFLVSDDTVGQEMTCPACAKTIVVEAAAEEEELGPRAEVAWEYSILSDLGRMGHVDEKKLNRLGHEGWELVNVFRESAEAHTCFYFKRRI